MSLLLLIPAFIALLIALMAICYDGIKKRAEPFLYSNISALPDVRTVLVLGTAKLAPKGGLNLYYKYRIAAAVKLYQQRPAIEFIVSGARLPDEDQPLEMKASMIAQGIPEEKIIMDPEGFRTFDSVWHCRHRFRVRRAIVISQQFHNERAIFLGQFMDIQLYGFNAQSVGGKSGIKIIMREWLARQKCLLDVFLLSIKKQPVSH